MGESTLNEMYKQYQVAPSQVHAWKKQLLEQGTHLFSKGEKESKSSEAELERKRSQLFAKIGQLTVERDFIKKAGAGSKGRLPVYQR